MSKSNRKIKRRTSVRNNLKNENMMISKLIGEAQSYYDQNQLEQANYLFQQVLSADERNISALNGLGLIAMQAGMLSLAIEFFSNACEIEPKNMTVNKNLALAYTRMSRYEEAILQYIVMLDIDESNSDVHGELARLNLQSGHLDLALNHYRYAFDLDPEDPRNLHGIVQLDEESITREDIETVENLLSQTDLSLEKRCSFYFALGNIYDGKQRYDEAFANYSVANMCKTQKFDLEKHKQYVSDVIATFSSDVFDSHSSSDANASDQPVFIIGMPRSGTTLVEQILASHSEVYAGGELTLIDDIAGRLSLDINRDQNMVMSLDGVDAESLNNLARFYLNSINDLAIKDAHKSPLVISDKLPGNFFYLGLIALLFPNAKIIHCRRNPLDVCLSCFFQNFSGDHKYASDLRSTALYYQQYDRLMDHWQAVLPLEIHTVNYEMLVNDTESISKQLIQFIDLDWQPQCLDFYDTKRNVNTASLVQVRNKIYSSSINRWQHYEKYLPLLKKTLNLFERATDDENSVLVNAHDFRKEYKAMKHIH